MTTRFTFTLDFDADDAFLNERSIEEEGAPMGPDSTVGTTSWAASRFLSIIDSMRDGDPSDVMEAVTITHAEDVPTIAFDKENGQAWGPFPSHGHAVDWVVEVLLATGEWTPDMLNQEVDGIEDDLQDIGWALVELTPRVDPDEFRS